MPKAVKRKNDVITPTDLAQSDDEEPPQLTAQQIAKKAFRESLAEPVPPSKHSGAGGNACSVEGIVLKGRKIMVSQKGTQVPKWMMDVAVMKVMGNGCKDVVTTGIDGVAYCLPTKATEASPDEIAKNKDAKGPIVLDVIDGNSSANYLGIVSASFYMDPNPKNGDTGPAVESCVPGTRVLISNVVATYGRDGSGGRLYCNAKKATPLSEVKPGEGAARIIEEARTNAAQQAASFLLSATMGGFCVARKSLHLVTLVQRHEGVVAAFDAMNVASRAVTQRLADALDLVRAAEHSKRGVPVGGWVFYGVQVREAHVGAEPP